MMKYQKQLRLLVVMKLIIICGLVGLCGNSAWAADIQIQHTPVPCMIAESPVEIMTHVLAENKIEEARLYFKTPEAHDFYVVHLQSDTPEKFTGILPAPQPDVQNVLYQLLFVDQAGQSVKSPLFTIRVAKDAATCPQIPTKDIPEALPVFAESDIASEIGFSAEFLDWKVSEQDARLTPYLAETKEIDMIPPLEADVPSKKSRFGKKTAIGLGAGAGLAAAVGLAVGGGGSSGSGSIWDSLDDVTENVLAELIKMPEIQTSCGTVVTNQLFLTNNTVQEIVIGTIDYEIVLTKDSPAGSCQPGLSGAFTPNLATMLGPGETALIREWANEVNPCSGCPYVVAECVWKSRYVVHTSVGSALAYASFAIEGDLCGTSLTAKPYGEPGNQIQGDIEP